MPDVTLLSNSVVLLLFSHACILFSSGLWKHQAETPHLSKHVKAFIKPRYGRLQRKSDPNAAHLTSERNKRDVEPSRHDSIFSRVLRSIHLI